MAQEEKRKYKILVADDDADVLSTMTLALGEFKQTVLSAADGLTALSLAETEDPDIIVLDVMLPKRGGFQLLQRLKGSPTLKGKRPLVCMVTGNEGTRHKAFADQHGADEYLRKPFPIGRLIEVVRGFIDQLDKGIPDAK